MFGPTPQDDAFRESQDAQRRHEQRMEARDKEEHPLNGWLINPPSPDAPKEPDREDHPILP